MCPSQSDRKESVHTVIVRPVRERAATFLPEAEAGADLPQYVKNEFGSLLECGTWRTVPEAAPW